MTMVGDRGERERARLEALDRLDAVRYEADHVLQGLVDDAREAFGTDLCSINLLLSRSLYFRAWSGELPEDLARDRRGPREQMVCRHVVGTEAPLVVRDFLCSGGFEEEPVCALYGVRFYAGVPLLTSEGHVVGSLCLLSAEPIEFDEHDLKLLQAFGRAVVSRLETLGSLGRERAAREEEARRRREVGRLARHNERILRSAVEGILGLDVGGKIEFANPAAAAMLGYEPEELVGENMHDLVHHTRPDGSPYPREECPNYLAVRNGITKRADGEVFWRRDGTAFPVEYASNPVLENDELKGAVVTFDDATERKETEEDLRQQRDLYETLLRAQSEAGEGLLIVEDRRVVYANEAFCAISGYGLEELENMESVVELLPPEHRAWAEGRLRRRTGFPEGFLGRRQVTILHKSGRPVSVELGLMPLRMGGKPRLMLVARDVTDRKEAEEALRESEERFRSLIQHASDIIVLMTGDGEIEYVSPSVRGIWGYLPEDLIGTDAYALVHPDDVERVRAFHAESNETPGVKPVLELRMRRADGSWRYVEGIGNNLLEEPSVGGIVVTLRDITERKEAEDALKESEQRFRSLVQNASDLITVLTADGVVLYESPAIEGMLGYAPEELIGSTTFDLIHPDDAPRVLRAFAKLSEDSGANPYIEYRFRHADGSWRHLESSGANLLDEPSVRGIVVNSRDVTERKALEERLTHQALHDGLTALPNRALFMDRLGHALDRGEAHAAVLFVDLDDFKVVNDSLGHEVGDRMLVAVGERLGTCLRPEDTLARLGGDEFAVLLEDVRGSDEATGAAGRIAEALRDPFTLGEHEVFVSASIGIALGGGDPRPGLPDDLLRQADMAMYEAKKKGKANHEVFEPRMDAPALGRLRMGTDLRRAVERGEFRVHYQPEVSLETGEVVGFEALVRWEHPEHGLVAPARFIPVAEETGLIVPMGRWVLEEACRQARAWQDLRPDGPPRVMSVNLSARQFEHPDLARDVARALRESGLEPGRLVLEITESVVMNDARSTVGTLGELKALGVRLAIDDFGTGYSSLSYLRRFPVDYLKVDRSFVDGIGEDPGDAVLVSGIVDLAHALGLNVVAEGVETQEQLALLRGMGCDLAQGYHFARPLPSEEASTLLARARPLG
ncbi:PAS domain S-box protein [Rubrobacter marinus]|uniref:PAS domain S-box protein n=1 Tax=Rubrobacter marinus TaxID=2653852 RepID=A0A6G8PY67_9ACTN|nr:PAS domain S-box protein [Rubrobacter marinus]QIN79146.1 PAS domain S-box protein [Rubrobacter marinus]